MGGVGRGRGGRGGGRGGGREVMKVMDRAAAASHMTVEANTVH